MSFVGALYVWGVLYLLAFIQKGHCQDEDEPKRSLFCRERDRPVSTESSDLFELITAELGQAVVMQCHYCNGQDNEEAKVWFKSDVFVNMTRSEIKPDMDNDKNLSRIIVDIDHSLNILNISYNDSGYYFCHNPEWNDSEKEFNFYVDVVAANTTNVEVGNLTTWANYSYDYFMPVNKLFNTSQGVEYLYLRSSLGLTMEITTKWSEWGPCEVCGRPQGEGIRRKMGICAIKITQQNDTTYVDLRNEDKQLIELDRISCRSLFLQRLLPGIYNTTCVIPDYEISERCEGVCNPDAEGIYRGWKSTKKTGYKYRKTFVLTENSHLTLVCPDSSLDNVVVWSRNGRKLPPGESLPPPSPDMEPKITVDTFNTLYLHEVTKEEEGNYTCQVDGVRMQQVVIFVVSKSRLLTQALLRHMMYLGFILSLTISCYVSGLVITCTRRHRFKTYRELRILNRNKEFLTDFVDDEEITETGRRGEKMEQPTAQVGFIQTCCGMRQKNSDKTLNLAKLNETSESSEIRDTGSSSDKKTKRYKRETASKKDVQHLLSTDSSEDEQEQKNTSAEDYA